MCVFIFGWALFICMPQSCYCHWHNYFLVERFSIPPLPCPPPSTKFQAVKNPNENRNNGKEMFFFGLHRPVQPVSFNGVRPSNCSWFHSPTLPAMYPGYLSIKFLNSSSKPPTNPYVHPIFRHSFVHPSGIHPHMHTDLPFIYPQNHPPIHATMHVTSHQPTVLY